MISQIIKYVGASVFVKAIGFVSTLWLASTLSIDEFGNWGLMYALQSGAAMFSSVGIADVLTGKFRTLQTAADRQLLFATSQYAFVVTGTFVLLTGLGLQVLVPVFKSVDGMTACLLAGILIGFGTLQAQLLRLNERHDDSLYFLLLVPLSAWLSGSIGLAVMSSITAFYWATVIAIFLLLIISWRRMPGMSEGLGGITVDSTQSIARGVSPYMIVAIVGWFCGYGNNFIIIALFDSVEVAKFTFLLALGSIIQIASTSMAQVWTPRFIHMSGNRSNEEVEDASSKFFMIQSIVMGLCVAIALPMAIWILGMLGGNLKYYAEARLEMFLLMAAYIVLIPWWHCYNHLVYRSHSKLIMVLTVGSSVVGFGLWIILMKVFGSIGIYLGFFSQLLIMSIVVSIYTQRLFVVRVPWLSALIGVSISSVGYMLTALPLRSS